MSERGRRRQLALGITALGLGLALGIAGRAGDGAAILFGSAALAAVLAAVLQQTLP